MTMLAPDPRRAPVLPSTLQPMLAKSAEGPLKIKTSETTDAVVGGWAEGQGGRSGGQGSLIVGRPAPDGSLEIPYGLRFRGGGNACQRPMP